jgi:hypothetical protein
MILKTVLIIYVISLVINLIYLFTDITSHRTKPMVSDYFLIFTPIFNTAVSLSIIVIETLLVINSIDFDEIFKTKDK